ncbi:OmpA family protein [Shewanella acanthi]|uniref:OmpA family protein n=1 Tax=Shewanella acanthi TaxID=2864212 RepID=UPI001C65B120|nr:OmpA family protein [Shewanella acanthi]QYJ79814.1 OmpA family protein [Shewanella acanthi]
MANSAVIYWVKLAVLMLSLCLIPPSFAWQDTDHDGVPDLKDACPGTPLNTVVMANGCLDANAVTAQENASNGDEVDLNSTVTQAESTQCDINAPNYSPELCHDISKLIVYFEFDVAVVDLFQMPTIKQVKAFLEANPRVNINIIGHTDIVGTPQYNYELSLKRALNVQRILVEDYGFNPNRFTVIGKGISEPVADNHSREGRRLNRRVEFFVNNK